MKKIINKQPKNNYKLFLTGIISFSFFAFSFSSKLEVKAAPYDNIASVNNEFIIEKEFNERFIELKTIMEKRDGVDFQTDEGKKELTELRKQAMKDLILVRIILQYAAKEKIVVTDDMVKKEIDKIKKATFDNNENKYKKTLEKNELSEDKLDKMLMETLIISKFRDKLFKKNVKITDTEIKNAYENHKEEYIIAESVEGSHILVKDKKLANEIYSKLQNGGNFAKLARIYSDDPGSSSKGGKLGYFHKGEMIPEFEKAAFSLKIGQISKPVKSTYGFHLIKITDHKPKKVISFNEARAKLTEQITTEKKQDFFKKWLEKAEKEADVKYYNFNIDE
jgi:foldase protein PrsA